MSRNFDYSQARMEGWTMEPILKPDGNYRPAIRGLPHTRVGTASTGVPSPTPDKVSASLFVLRAACAGSIYHRAAIEYVCECEASVVDWEAPVIDPTLALGFLYGHELSTDVHKAFRLTVPTVVTSPPEPAVVAAPTPAPIPAAAPTSPAPEAAASLPTPVAATAAAAGLSPEQITRLNNAIRDKATEVRACMWVKCVQCGGDGRDTDDGGGLHAECDACSGTGRVDLVRLIHNRRGDIHDFIYRDMVDACGAEGCEMVADMLLHGLCTLSALIALDSIVGGTGQIDHALVMERLRTLNVVASYPVNAAII